MRISILELPARWNRAAEVLADVDAQLAGADTDLVLLPEAAICGYISPDADANLAPFAEPLTGPTGTALAQLAARHHVHLVAPLVLAEDGRTYNAMACWDPHGQHVFTYRKRHPWLPERWATPGAEPLPLVEIAGLQVTLAICFDLHFLPDESAAQLRAADLLLFPSAWVEDPDTREDHLAWLARTFDVAIANANWGPGEIVLPGQGGSCVIDRRGRVVARGGDLDVSL